jgi:hypothetical protein
MATSVKRRQRPPFRTNRSRAGNMRLAGLYLLTEGVPGASTRRQGCMNDKMIAGFGRHRVHKLMEPFLQRLSKNASAVRLAQRVVYGPGSLPPMFFRPGSYYSTIPSEKDIAKYLATARQVPDSLGGIDLNLDGQLRLLRAFQPFYDEQPFTIAPRAGFRYRFENDWYPCADGLILYCLLRLLRPKRLIEVGSGWSTCVTLDTREHFLGSLPAVTLVEPHPERLLELVSERDLAQTELHRSEVQDIPLKEFEKLEDGDVLFVDSTHVTKLGSDVNYLVFEVLPCLARGVYVHFHDIHYPFEYTPPWVKEGWGWNEAYLLRAFLQYNSDFEVALWYSLLKKQTPDVLQREFPLLLENPGVSDQEDTPAGSLWLRKRG